MKEKTRLYYVYQTMIETAHLYDDKFERLECLKHVINMIPMKYVMEGIITTSECSMLEEQIENKINKMAGVE